MCTGKPLHNKKCSCFPILSIAGIHEWKYSAEYDTLVGPIIKLKMDRIASNATALLYVVVDWRLWRGAV